jgi:SpoVK/Ycf46/Vps4 family AAA+-type ATPase
MAHDSVISALATALEASPDDLGLRLHLATLLTEKGDHAAALDHYARALVAEPANVEALAGAAGAARETGDAARAAGYERLLAALGVAHPPPSTTPPPDSSKESGDVADFTAERARLRVVQGGDQPIDEWEAEQPTITLDDVGGMDEVKRRLQVSFLAPLKNPDMMKMYGKSLRGGLLLYGPPGCGKTFIARATAGELGAKFFSVGLSDVLDMWFGESERRLHEIFERARRSAPSVLFFDEIDALGQKRSQLKHSAGRNLVNQLLAELDSAGTDNRGVFVLAATNHPWDVDTALRRPGRFDRMMLVLPPDDVAREAILNYHLKSRPVGSVDLRGVASKTRGYSGADLAHLCESAAETALEESLARGVARPIEANDFRRALSEVKSSTRAWFDAARNYAMFANEGGMYDDLLAYMRANKLC